MEWFDPYYHATLFPSRTARNYLYDEDQNGDFIIRNSDDYDVETTCDYVFTHFTLHSPQLPGGEVYLNGEWTCNRFTPQYRMTYNREKQAQLRDERDRERATILNDIRKAVENHATLAGFSLVVDKSAISASGMPIVLYSSKAVEISEPVLKELNTGRGTGK